jgi:hypothetical protein
MVTAGGRWRAAASEQPTRIDFLINLQTARKLGITVAPSLLQTR